MKKRAIDELTEQEHTALCASIGNMLLTAPRLSVMMGHSSVFSTMADYLRNAESVPATPVQKVVHLASEFLNDIAQMALMRKRMTVEELADKWSPVDEAALIKDL